MDPECPFSCPRYQNERPKPMFRPKISHDRRSALEERFGLCVAALNIVDLCEVVKADSGYFLPQRDGFLTDAFVLLYLA